MTFLALECSTSACSAALWREGCIASHRFRAMSRGQSEHLVPMVAEVMTEAGIDFSALTAIAVTVGPGAFTGIRIGLATARALGLAAAKPVMGISTLRAVAAAIPNDQRKGRPLLVVMDSKRDDVWAQLFDETLAPLSPPTAILPEDLPTLTAEPLSIVGDAAELARPVFPGGLFISGNGLPDAATVAVLAAQDWEQGRIEPPDPLYLRPADVTMPTTP